MSKSKIEDVKDAIAAKRGTSEERAIHSDMIDAKVDDLLEWYERHTTAQDDLIKQMARLLDPLLPDWRSV